MDTGDEDTGDVTDAGGAEVKDTCGGVNAGDADPESIIPGTGEACGKWGRAGDADEDAEKA